MISGDFDSFWVVSGGFDSFRGVHVLVCTHYDWMQKRIQDHDKHLFFFPKKVNDWKLLTIFWKRSILDAWLYMTSKFTKSSTSALITLSHLKFVALTTKYSFTYESISAVRVLWWLNASVMAWLTMPTFSLNSLAIFRRRVQVCFNDKKIW